MTTINTQLNKQADNKLEQWISRPVVEFTILAAIVGLAAVLRLYKLGEWSFWIDELYTVGRVQAQYSSFEQIKNYVPPNKLFLPLSFIVTGSVLNVWGVSEWSARLVSLFVGLVSIPIIYLPVKRIFGVGIGLTTVLILAVSPWHLFWSQNARFYTSLMLVYTLALFSFYFALEYGKLWLLVLFGIFAYLAVSERFTGMFLVPVIVFYLLVLALRIGSFERPPGLQLRNSLLLGLLALAIVMILLNTSTVGISNIANDLRQFAEFTNTDPIRLLFSIIFRLGIPLAVISSISALYWILQRQRAALFIILSAALPVAILVGLSSFMFTVDRYIFMTLPFWIILASVFVWELVTRVKGKYDYLFPAAILAILLAVSFGELFLYYNFQNGNRPDWVGAMAAVREMHQEGDIITATRQELGTYYLGKNVRNVNSMEPDSIIENGKRVWFVIDEATANVEPTLHYWIRKNSQLVDIYPVNLPGKSLSIRLYLYDPLTNRLPSDS